MGLQAWWLFVGMTFVESATPGPNMLLVMSHSARFGLRAAVVTMAGCMTALLCMMSISAAGLGALLHTFPAVFDALRYLGAAYLAYLGYKLWRASVAAKAGQDAAVQDEPLRSGGSFYRQGLAVAASNPKAIVFSAAFFPQFINPDSDKLPQFAILLTTFTVIEVTWYFVYAVSGKRLSVYLHRTSIMKAFNRATSGGFLRIAALMATARA